MFSHGCNVLLLRYVAPYAWPMRDHRINEANLHVPLQSDSAFCTVADVHAFFEDFQVQDPPIFSAFVQPGVFRSWLLTHMLM